MNRKFSNMVCLEGAEAPTRIQVLPLGTFITNDWRKLALTLTPEMADVIISEFDSLKGDMVIDYHHATVRGEGKAPAAGWIKKLERDDNGLYAIVEWTPPAQEHIKIKEYRYFSAVVQYDESGKIYSMLHGSLTNTPAVDGMDPLTLEQEENVNKAVLKALGLPDTATEADVISAIAALQAAPSSSVAVLEALGLKKDATEPEVIGAIKGLTENKTALESLQTKVAALEADRTKSEATVIVEDAIKSGKIALAQKDAAIAMAEKDLKGYIAYLEKAPVILDMSQRTGGEEKQPQQAALSAEIKAVAAQFGLTDDDLKTYGGIQ